MSAINIGKLKARLIKEEGRTRLPYKCSMGYLTCGIGRNLEAVPFSDDEIDLMFENDVLRVLQFFDRIDWFGPLSDVRKRVILEMGFQLGGHGVLDFKNMISAIKRGDYRAAAEEMRNSKWGTQTPTRCKALSRMMHSDMDLIQDAV